MGGTGQELLISIPNKDIVGVVSDYNQEVMICNNCKLVYTRNPFNASVLENRYASFSKFEFDSEDYIWGVSDEYADRCVRQKQFIERHIPLEKIKSIFEVGASSGFNLGLYTSTMDVYGVEPSKANVANASKRYNVKLYNGMFDAYYEEVGLRKKYDLIFLSMTLEHIVNPGAFLKRLSKINNAYMFIEVPTFDYKFSDEAYGMFCEEHVNMFTLESLQNIMNLVGYELIAADMILEIGQTLPAGWPGIDTLWIKNGNPKTYKSIGNTRERVIEYIADCRKNLARCDKLIDKIDDTARLAVWGTGHHASMLYANTCLHKKNIVKVFDSDTKKHGMTMFGHVIEPFNIKVLDENEIDVILLATYTAQNAIMRHVRNVAPNANVILLYPDGI